MWKVLCPYSREERARVDSLKEFPFRNGRAGRHFRAGGKERHGTAKVIDMDDFLSYGKKGNKFGDTLPETSQDFVPSKGQTRSFCLLLLGFCLRNRRYSGRGMNIHELICT